MKLVNSLVVSVVTMVSLSSAYAVNATQNVRVFLKPNECVFSLKNVVSGNVVDYKIAECDANLTTPALSRNNLVYVKTDIPENQCVYEVMSLENARVYYVTVGACE